VPNNKEIARTAWNPLCLFGVAVLLLLAALGSAPAAFASESPVAAYSFDEGEGTVAHDSSGNGNEGEIEGAEWTTGKYGGALNFDAEEGDVVTIPDTEGLDSEEFTLEAWVRPDEDNFYGPIVAHTAAEGHGYALFTGNEEEGFEGFLTGFISFHQWVEAHTFGAKLALNTWTHVAVISDGEEIKLYINGALVDERPSEEVTADEAPLQIGGDEPFAEGHFFDGKIDEVRVYNRALDAEEVREDKKTAIQTPPSEEPVAAYSFDEGEDTVAHDSSGNGNEGEIEGAEWTTGKYGGALNFDAEAGDVVTVPDSEGLDLEEFTLEAWVRPDEATPFTPILAHTDPEGYGYGLYAAGNEEGAEQHPMGFISFHQWVNAHAYDGGELNMNAWTHVAVTNDGKHISLYVNGTLVDERESEEALSGEAPLQIGGDEPFAEGHFFDGKIDEVRVYNRALDAEEVREDKKTAIQTPASKEPVAAYSFDEGEGETLYDDTGNGHDGTIEGAEWVGGKYGSALHFNGEGDCVTVPDSEAFGLEGEFTLEAWVRPDETRNWGAALSKEAPGELFDYALFPANHVGVPAGIVANGSGGAEVEVPGEEELPVGAWSHLALTSDGETMRLYEDGEEIASEPTPAIPAREGPLQIGCATGYGDFNGRVDDLRIYNQALTQAKIDEDKEVPVGTENIISGTITPSAKGTSQKTSFTVPGQVAHYSVPVLAGESVSIASSPASLNENYRMEWRDSEGNALKAWESFSEISGFASAVRFEQAETAVLVVDPEDNGTGNLTLTLYDASDKTTDSIVPSVEGSTNSYSVDVPGQQNRISFEGTKGQWLSILPSQSSFDGNFFVRDPKGETVENSGGGLMGSRGPIVLPESGTFEVVLTGIEGSTGTVDLCARVISEAAVDSSCGPVAAFSFDEGPGDLVRSERGDLTGLAGEPEWTGNGRFGGALEFDGSDDTVTIPDSSGLDLTEGFTLEAWVLPWTTAGFGDIFAKEASESPYYSYLFYAYAEGKGPRGIAGTETWTSSSEALPTNAWSYVAFTSDGSETHVYVNGKLKASGGATSLAVTDGPLRIGGNAIWGDHFDGRIDEARLYDRSLNGTEISADMGTPVPTASRPSPVVALGFDEDEGDVAHDSAARSNALLEDAVWSDGRFGSGVEFDGEGDPAHISANAALDFSREFTADAWVKPEAFSGTATILSKRDSDEAFPFGYRLYLNGEEGALAADIASSEGPSASLEDTEPLPLGVWSHVALTSDGSEARLYVNGLLVASEASVPSKPTDGPLEIGGAEGGEDRFQGQIDEVRLYRARLSSEEIRRDMEVRVTPSHGEPSMALRFDADVEGVALDSAGDHNGTIHGAAHAADRDGHVLELDGETDRVTVPNASELDLQDEGFALSAWVYPTSSESWSPLIVKGDPGEVGPDYDFALYSRGGGDGPAMAVVSGEGTPELIDGETALPLETWSLVTATASAGQMRLYVDGELAASGSGSTPRLSGGDLEIGGSTAVGHYFSGEIDDVEIYNEALSAKEVADARDATPPRFVLSGPLFESRGGPLGVESADLYIDPTDPGEEASGIRSVEVFVDGQIAEVFRCGCEEEALTFTYDSAVWGKGRHTVTVSATDRRDFETEQSFTIDESEGPGIEYGGPLFLRRGNPMGTELRELTINLTQTDHSALAPRPGVQSYQVFVDGSPVTEPVTQTCEEGNCGMEDSWTMDPTEFSNGSHFVQVEAVDQAGNSNRTHFEIEIDNGDPCADQDEAEPEACGLSGYQIIEATEFEELEGERAEAVAEEWIQPGTKNERRANNSEASRGTTACPEDPESTCEEVRVFGPESESDDQLFVTVSTELEDPDLETVTDLNAFTPDEGQEPIATGPINEALAPWQDAPPGHGSTYEAFEDVPKLEASESEGPELEPEEEEIEEEGLGVKTIWWIDSKTGLPLRKLEEVGPDVRRFYFDFGQRERSADELPPNFFLAEMPPWGVAEVVRNVEDEPGDLTYIEVGE
jgi:hypothetical protein